LIIPFVNRLLHWMVTGIMTTVMSLMILSKGLTIESLGFISAATSLIVVILEFPSGILSDAIGRKRVYMISIAFSLAARLILVPAEGFLPIFLGFALYAISRAFSSGSIEAIYINDFIRKRGPDNLHKLMSVMSAGETIGLASGALLGGLLPMLWDRLRPDDNRYNGNLVAQIIILCALAALTMSTTREEKASAFNPAKFGTYIADSFRTIRASKILGLMLAGACFWGLTFSAIEVYWQPRLKDLLGSDSQTWIFGIISSGYFLASLFGVLAIGPLLSKRRVSPLSWIFILRLLSGALILLLAAQRSIFPFSAVYLLMFFLNGMTNIPESTLFNQEIPEDKRSSLLSVSSLAVQLGGAAGSLLFAALVKRLSIPGVWIVAGALFSASSLLYLKAAAGATPFFRSAGRGK